MRRTYLDKVYDVRGGDNVRDLYDEWSESYDAEVSEKGYATPRRCAEALAHFVEDRTLPLLDFGCGTGLSGLAFKMAGFDIIDGVDLSSEMLAKASEKSVYRKLNKIEPDSPVPKGYSAVAAVGVIGAGAAPISLFDKLMHAIPRNGKLVFSFNDHALADAANTGRMNEWLDCGAARLLFSEYGAHLPGLDMNSNVYVIEKA